MSDRHELFEELEAFHPLWFKVYHNLEEAVEAASIETPYIIDLWEDYLLTTERIVDGVPDIKKYIEECQEAEQNAPEFQRAVSTIRYVNRIDDNKFYFSE